MNQESVSQFNTDILNHIQYGLDKVLSVICVVFSKFLALAVIKSILDSYRDIKENLWSEDAGKRRKYISKVIRTIIIGLFPALWVLLISCCLYAIISNYKSSDHLVIINKEELNKVFRDVSTMLFKACLVSASMFLPSNILTISIFVLFTAFILYLIYGSTIATSFKFFAGFLVCVGAVLGFNIVNNNVENYTKRIQNMFRTLNRNLKTILPLFFISSFIIALQTLLSSILVLEIGYKWIYIIPVLLLSDWTYNIVYNINNIFLMSFLCQSTEKPPSLRTSISICKENLLEVIFRSFQTSLFSVLFNFKILVKFFSGEQGPATMKLTNFEALIKLLLNINELYTDRMFYKMGLDGVKSREKSEIIEEKQQETLIIGNELAQAENENNEDAEDTVFKSGESILLYLFSFKNFAFRIPMVLSAISFFDIQFVGELLNCSSSLAFIRNPIFFFEKITKNPSLASFIGLLCHLIITFYILSIPISYFANKYHEAKLSKNNPRIIPPTGAEQVVGAVSSAANGVANLISKGWRSLLNNKNKTDVATELESVSHLNFEQTTNNNNI